MRKKIEPELYKTAARTFEEVGFMLPSPEPGKNLQNAKVEAAATVAFYGPFSGKLVVKVSGGLLPALAANMLGEDDPPTEAQQHDALGEITNIICGNVLPAIAGGKEVFKLLAPQVAKIMGTTHETTKPPIAEVQMALDQGRADLLFFIDGEATNYFKEQQN